MQQVCILRLYVLAWTCTGRKFELWQVSYGWDCVKLRLVNGSIVYLPDDRLIPMKHRINDWQRETGTPTGGKKKSVPVPRCPQQDRTDYAGDEHGVRDERLVTDRCAVVRPVATSTVLLRYKQRRTISGWTMVMGSWHNLTDPILGVL